MKVRELLERLSSLNPDMEIMILDGFNGGGLYREINFGPTNRIITEDDIDNGDCIEPEIKIGDKIIVIGYGCY